MLVLQLFCWSTESSQKLNQIIANNILQPTLTP
jgi:hypothetical protein